MLVIDPSLQWPSIMNDNVTENVFQTICKPETSRGWESTIQCKPNQDTLAEAAFLGLLIYADTYLTEYHP